MKSLNEQKYHRMIDFAIIWVTLGTLFIIPIIFNYFHIFSIFTELKLVTLHFGAGLISILCLWQFIFYREAPVGILKKNLGGVLRPSMQWNLTNWALIGASVWFIALIISTILSPISSVSFFGAEDNRSGYSLYDYISLFIIFLSIAFRFRSIASLKLLVYTLISTGTVVAAYGISQHFQWDPIGGNIGLNRVQASFGNPLDFGAYLVMTIPATLALAFLINKHKYSWISWSILPAGLQLAGLWFSGSRGPYIATSTAVIAFFVIAIVIGQARSIIRPTLVLIAAGLIAAAIIILPSPRDDIGLQRLSSIENQITSSITTSNEVSGGLIGRFNIWDPTFELAAKWPVPAQESFVFTLLRPMFGLGPDMYVYSFPIVQKPRTGLQVVDHTHNYELQILMEQGFIGLMGFLIFTSCLIVSIVAIARRLRSTENQLSITTFLVLGLSPSIIGKIIEIQTGVARISDLTMMFALFGGIVALYKITNRQETFSNSDQVELRTTQIRKLMFKPSHSGFLISKILVFSMAAIVIISTFIQWDMRRLSASRWHAIGLSATSKVDQVQAWAHAQSQAPERPSFTNDLFTEYFHAAMYHHDRGENHEAIQLMLLAHELLLQFEDHDPFKRDIQINLLQSEVALIQWGQLQYTQSAVDRAEKIISLYLSYPSLISVVATNMTLIGMHQLAIEYSDRVINTEKETQAWSKAWYAKGRALYQLGYIEEAIKILNKATEKRPGAEGSIYAHKLLGQIHSKNGVAEDLTLWKFHNVEGDKAVTVQE